MSKLLDHYLDRVLAYANRPEPEARAIRAELKDHLLQKIEDLTAGGMGREDAAMEALRQHGNPRMIGYKLRPAFPWVDIRSRGTARGVIAIGPRAVGIFAFGGVAIGVVASGGFSCGLISAGGFAFGLLFAWAGFACGGIAIGGFSAGLAYGLWGPNADRAVSYFAGKNVPDWLRGLKPLLGVGQFLGRHFIGFTISYVAVVFSLSALQRREELRLRKGEDWLLED
jgi:hypothetical protein